MHRILSSVFPLCACLAFCVTAQAQYVPATIDGVDPDAVERPAPRVHLGLETVFSNRNFSASGRQGSLDYSAPMAAGLRVSGAFYPMALLLSERGPADGIGFYADTMRHSLLTEVPVRSEGQTLLVDVPTRYAATHFGLIYDIRPSPEVAITPVVGMQRASYTLGFNRLLNSVSYRSVDLGADLTWHHPSRLVILLGGRVRPGVNPGNTGQRFGVPVSGLGWRAAGMLRYPLWLGLAAEAGYSATGYRTTYEADDVERQGSLETRATDVYHTLSLGLRYLF